MRNPRTHLQEPQHRIGLLSAVAFAVGTMVGAGVFVLSGVAVKNAGPSAIISFLCASAVVSLAALSFAVVASLAEPGGSGYSYVSKSLGNFWGFLTSWSFYLGAIAGVAFVLHAFSFYMHDFFFPHTSPFLWALGSAACLTLLNLGPASAVGQAEVVLVGLKIGILGILITGALCQFHLATFTPFAPHGVGKTIATSALLFIAFLGFNVITNMAGDIENPSKTIPRAIILSMGIVTVIYVGVVIALITSGLRTFDEASVGKAAELLLGRAGSILIPIGALVSTLSAANANILGASEIMVRLAADRDVPTIAGRLWHGHPIVSVLIGASAYISLLIAGGAETIINIANVTAICAMSLVCLAGAKALRAREPGVLRLPFGPWLSILGFLSVIAQLAFIPFFDIVFAAIPLALGTLIYLNRERFHHPEHHRIIVEHLATHAGPAGRALRRRQT